MASKRAWYCSSSPAAVAAAASMTQLRFFLWKRRSGREKGNKGKADKTVTQPTRAECCGPWGSLGRLVLERDDPDNISAEFFVFLFLYFLYIWTPPFKLLYGGHKHNLLFCKKMSQ
jgi:hypothetical protein